MLKKKGYTQMTIAKMIGVSHVAVHQIIYGNSKSRRIQQKIAEILGQEIEDIWPLNAA
jgi:DNA-binding XRE family transcriptional regulator